MEPTQKAILTVENIIQAPVEKVWDFFTSPKHITQWNQASPDWHSPRSENDLRVGGRFLTRMEAKDGSFGFDFGGVYTEVKTHQVTAYTMDDGRTVRNVFTSEGGATKVTTTFEAESENPLEMQKGGWQAILDSFKKYTESN